MAPCGKNKIPTDNALERKLLCQKTCGTVTSHSELPGICIYRILNKEGLMERLNIKEHQRCANSETSTETWHGLTSLPIFPDRICTSRLFIYKSICIDIYNYIYNYLCIHKDILEYASSALECPAPQLLPAADLPALPGNSEAFPPKKTSPGPRITSQYHPILRRHCWQGCNLSADWHFYCFTWRRLLVMSISCIYVWIYIYIM